MPTFVQRDGRNAVILEEDEVMAACLAYLAARGTAPALVPVGGRIRIEEPDEHTWNVVIVAYK